MENNSFLLDTHIFIWAMEKNKRLPETLKNKISDPQNKIYISVATVWEIVIKKMTKQIEFKFDLEFSIEEAGFEILPIQVNHVLHLFQLPLSHKDPFDRILISQAESEHMTLISADERIWQYKLSLIKVQ